MFFLELIVSFSSKTSCKTFERVTNFKFYSYNHFSIFFLQIHTKSSQNSFWFTINAFFVELLITQYRVIKLEGLLFGLL